MFRVRFGHRRTLAAIEAELPTVPVYVIGDEATSTAGRDRASARPVRRERAPRRPHHRRPGATSFEQLSLLKVSPTQIAKRTRMARADVDHAVAVGKSTTARDLARSRPHSPTATATATRTSRADLGAPCGDRRVRRRPRRRAEAHPGRPLLRLHPHPRRAPRRPRSGPRARGRGRRAGKRRGCGSSSRPHHRGRPAGPAPGPPHRRQRRQAHRRHSRHLSRPRRLAGQGVGMGRRRRQRAARRRRRRGVERSDDEAEARTRTPAPERAAVARRVRLREPGRARTPQHLQRAPGQREDPDGSAAEAGEKTEEQKEAERVERRRVIAGNKQWDTAVGVRRAWLRQFLTRKTPPAGAVEFIAQAVAHADAALRRRVRTQPPTRRRAVRPRRPRQRARPTSTGGTAKPSLACSTAPPRSDRPSSLSACCSPRTRPVSTA